VGVVFRVHAQVKKIIEVAALGKDLVHVNAFGQLFTAIFTGRIQVAIDDRVIVHPRESL
jgi:hypothetical protein